MSNGFAAVGPATATYALRCRFAKAEDGAKQFACLPIDSLGVSRRSGQPTLVPQVAEAVDGVLVPAVNIRKPWSSEQASLARTLYTQCVAAVPNRVIVVLGATEDSGTSAIASMFDFAAAGVIAFLLACLWKGFMLVSTVPFAALRKAGETALVFRVRALSTVIYLAIGVAFLVIWHSTAAIFLSFVLAEVITALVYHYAATRGAPEYRDSFGATGRPARGDSEN